jgi:hypothetical protein
VQARPSFQAYLLSSPFWNRPAENTEDTTELFQMDPMDALSQPRGFEVELGFVASRGPVSRGTIYEKDLFFFLLTVLLTSCIAIFFPLS